MWSSVGSVGSVNIADISKVDFQGPAVELAGGLVGPTAAAEVERIRRPPTMSATVRYPVQESDLGNQPAGLWTLNVVYRDGAGTVLITLREIDRFTGVLSPPLLVFDTNTGDFSRANDFHFHQTQATFATDFNTKAYYVELTLTGPHGPNVTVLPGVAVMQLTFA